MIDVQRLRVLRAVAEHGSFNQAATALLLTPSAVSQHVASLERSLGAQVVARSTRGVTLTQAGRIMVGAAESVAAELEHAQQQVARLSTGRTQLGPGAGLLKILRDCRQQATATTFITRSRPSPTCTLARAS